MSATPNIVPGCVILTGSGEKFIVAEEFEDVAKTLDDPDVRTLHVHRPNGVDVAIPMRNVEAIWKRTRAEREPEPEA
jgi:hypothetical protein